MKNEKMNENEMKFITAVTDAISETGYVKGRDTRQVLEETLVFWLNISNIDNLWGPAWSLFVVATARRMKTVAGIKVSYKAIKHVISRMSGYDKVVPADLVGQEEIQSIEDSSDTVELEECLFTAFQISWELNKASPVEADYLYACLGEDASPTDAEILWLSDPEKPKLDITDAEAVIAMAEAIVDLNSENQNLEFVGEEAEKFQKYIEEYHNILRRAANRCAVARASKALALAKKKRAEIQSAYREEKKAKEEEKAFKESLVIDLPFQPSPTPKPTPGPVPAPKQPTPEAAQPNSEELMAKIATLNASADASYRRNGCCGGGGGSSSGWTAGEIALGAVAAVAVGAALWYGYDRLVADDFDIEVPDFDIPDFDVPDF